MTQADFGTELRSTAALASLVASRTYIWYISPMTSEPPDNRYRRRFLVEFTPAESDLADRMGSVHGSKRRAIVNGLQLLDSGEVDALRAQVAALEKERDTAKASATKASEGLATAKERAAGAKEAAGDLRAERAAHAKTRSDLAQTQQEIASVRQALANAQAELQRYAAALPTMAYCPDCQKYVPRSEWAEQAAEGGVVHVYHSKHDYRPKGSITKYPSVLFWRGGAGR